MKKVGLISTGGTIASKVDPITGKMMAGEQTGKELLDKCNLKYLGDELEIKVNSLFQIPSNQMDFYRLEKLYNKINEMKNNDYDAIVITHGTDTLEETAYFLDLVLDNEIPVVITGSQFSPTTNNTDAYHNLSNAILVASSEKSKDAGTVVVFNDRIFSPRYVTKIHASNINGFGAPRNGNIGIVDFGRVEYFYNMNKREHIKIHQNLPKVGIYKECLGNDPSMIDYYIENNYSGIIVEGYGRGHTNLGSRDKLIEAICKGITVVITTTCMDGKVEPVYGYLGSLDDLTKNGALSGHDYTAKQARIKLMLLLANEYSKDEIKKSFENY